jgi:hypothetical protein
VEQIELVKTKTDPCFYVSVDKTRPFFLFAHVDDLIFGGSWLPGFKQKINNCFEMEDLGKVRYALGIRITQSLDKISLVQDKYINNILAEFNIVNHQNTPAPLPSNWNLEKDKPSEALNPPLFNYCQLVGLLQWLVQCIRPDLAFAASCLAQFLEDPSAIHFQAGIHVLRYLNNTKSYTLDLGINKLKSKTMEVIGFADANHGGAKERKLYSGSLVYYQGLIGWRSHIQKSTTLLSAKLELVALVECSQDVLWVSNLLQETVGLTPTLRLVNDNLSTHAICLNEIYHHSV